MKKDAKNTMLPETSPTIRLLDPHTINQIAAGEVVERPASALKELIENSLDAGAATVLVELEAAGVKRIEVSDDGCGMNRESAILALQRHATSKIERIEDLTRVVSMGFRGEALPAIASVSVLTLESGSEDGKRIRLRVDGGDIKDEPSVAGPRGTRVSVEELFATTPARLKFLKSDSTELSQCVEVVGRAALARPDVRFTLKHNGSVLLQTSGSSSLATAVAEVWGRDAARGLVPFDRFDGTVRAWGLISPPHFTKPTRSHQWTFVNQRPMKSRILTAALDQATKSLTPERRYPLALLCIEIDPAAIDVNVSPTKSEVKFTREGPVFDVVRRAIRDALLEAGMVPDAAGLAAANEAMRALQPPGPSPLWMSFVAQSPLAPSSTSPENHSLPFAEPGYARPDPSSAPTALPDLLAGLRVLGQVDKTFIIAENDAGMLIIDQHVAHERIIYERLKNSRGALPVEVQPLLTPEVIHLDRRALEEVRPRLQELKEVGYDCEIFGDDSLLVRSVPGLARGRSPLKILRDILDQLADGQTEGCIVPARDEVYILASCKMAIKAGDVIGIREMEQLLQDLSETENPYFCPHGRPISILMPKGDLRRRFKR